MSEREPTPEQGPGDQTEVIEYDEPVMVESETEEPAAPQIPEEALIYDPRFSPEVLEALRGEAVVKDIPGRANLSGVEKTESRGYVATSFGESYVEHLDNQYRTHFTPLSSFDFADGRISEPRRQQLAASGIDFDALSQPLPGMPEYSPAPVAGGNGNGDSNGNGNNPENSENGNGHENGDAGNGEDNGNNNDGDENELGKRIDPDDPEFVIPESVANNYTVRKRESGLLVAESRAYHSSKIHKSDNENRLKRPGIDGPIPEKQRGIVERDTQLAGKDFVIAERPPSNKRRDSADVVEPEPPQEPNSPNNPNNPDNPGNAPNQGQGQGPNRREQQIPHEFRQPRLGFEHPSFAHGKTVNGEYQTVVRYGQDGDKMIWNVNDYTNANKPDREILMHLRDENGNDQVRFIRGGRIYEIVWSERSGNKTLPMLKVRNMRSARLAPVPGTTKKRLIPPEELKSLQIGKNWGDSHGRTLQSVMINAGRDVSSPNGAEVDSELASDPFARIKEVIAHMELGAAGAKMNTEVEEDFYRRAFDEMFAWEHSHIGEISPQDVPDRIAAFAGRFQDETYVPSDREFKEMRAIREMLGGDAGLWDEQAAGLNIGGRDLDLRLVNAFLEGANPDRWRLNEHQTDTYRNEAHRYRQNHRISFDAETKPTRPLLTGATGGGVHTIPEFLDIKNEQKQQDDRDRLARGERPGAKPSQEQREREYYEYIFRRGELGKLILDIDSWDNFGLRQSGNGGNSQPPRTERQNRTQVYNIDPDLIASRGIIDYLSRVRDRWGAGWQRRMRG
ncbi:MAG TPA: hypothetical protein VFW77_00500 [Candidatus Saccharimonadales bacterium]|nr:hypothetical protein [Candidatus Saccharimonadales bacterium]